MLADNVCVSDGWFYARAYAPTAMDLSLSASVDALALAASVRDCYRRMDAAYVTHDVTLRSATNIVKRTSTSTSTSGDATNLYLMDVLHLLMVLPPASAALLPDDATRSVLSDPDLGCVHMYPTNFLHHTYLRERKHECAPVLPDVDARALQEALCRRVYFR